MEHVEDDPEVRRGRPAEWVADASSRFGEVEVALRCAELLRGGDDAELLRYLAGPAIGLAATVDYWPRVWAARGLRYAWDERAVPAVLDALTDPAWRVREMAAKVALQYELGETAEALAELTTDPVPRVRAAAAAALAQVGEAEQADVLRVLLDDPESLVSRRAERSLRALSQRLDRDL
jgi:HEAT repeat protein